MARRLSILGTMMCATWLTGCALCCAPYDCNYPHVGGRWVRDNPAEGRVGSAFAPAGHRVDEQPSLDGNLAPETGERSVLPQRDGASYLPTEE
jgi:hypothetical protein